MKTHLWLAVMLLLLAGCTQPSSSQNTLANHDLELSLTQLQNQVKALQVRIDAQDLLIKQDGKAISELNYPKETGQVYATVDCAEHSYGSLHVRGTALTLLVSCEDVKGYLAGSSLKLQIGNPHAMTFSGLSYIVGTGSDSFSAYQAMQDPAQQLTGKLTEQFRSAYWTKVTITAPNTKPDASRFVAIRLASDLVQLYMPKGSVQ